jgi:lysyl-tRNA synthetase class 2
MNHECLTGSSQDWRPSCSGNYLRLRAQMLQKIRRFFEQKSVLEVETPLLASAIGTDPNLDFFCTEFSAPPLNRKLFLQTSPEFVMKRLLAAGSGSIFQVCKAFRNGESGRYHNPEFTLLEWYRVGFDLEQLMAEIAELMEMLLEGLPLQKAQKISYSTLFEQVTSLNCLAFSSSDYCAYVKKQGLEEAVRLCGHDHAIWLDFIFSHCIQPNLGKNEICMVYGYPAVLSSLARNNAQNPLVTERVELFLYGVELGNGYHELTDTDEQERRFDAEIALRKDRQLPEVAKDERLLAALRSGLPDCAGMAIGLDRLLMLLSNSLSINEVIAFPTGKA